VQRPLTSGPRGWLTGQLLCPFGPKLCGQMSTREGEGQGGEESRWRPYSLADLPHGLATQPPLGLNHVGGAPPRPDKYPPTVEMRRHTTF
jgi:hypothetical protein